LVGLDFTGGISVTGSTVQFNGALKLHDVTPNASLSFDKLDNNIVCTCTATHIHYGTFVHF